MGLTPLWLPTRRSAGQGGPVSSRAVDGEVRPGVGPCLGAAAVGAVGVGVGVPAGAAHVPCGVLAAHDLDVVQLHTTDAARVVEDGGAGLPDGGARDDQVCA